MTNLIGRKLEQDVLKRALDSREPELIALVGRRRVGKTFLVRNFFGSEICFEMTGIHGANRSLQLRNFSDQLRQAMKLDVKPEVPTDWYAAFQQLIQFLESRKGKARRVVFLDELPWLASRKSGFLSALEHFWNSWGSRQHNLIVVICGSAASWMIDHVIHDRGGLYQRVTRHLHLQPFSLREVAEYLNSRSIRYEPRQITELYMALGGVPHYLREVQPGLSAAQNLDQICFASQGILVDEYSKLYAALFENPDRHVDIIQALAKRLSGVTRSELLESLSYLSGGRLTKTLDELMVSGFIERIEPWGKQRRDAMYRLIDEFSLFYLKWMKSRRNVGKEAWLNKRGTPAWRAWTGFAFENICHRHIQAIKANLGIAAVETQHACWQHRAKGDIDVGAQVDLLIDRRDDVINLCEIKYADDEFVIDQRYAKELRRKLDVFRRVSGTRKSVQLTMITTFGVRKNQYATELVDSEVKLSGLFD
ncbi:MAG: AAA family ATPase [Planctomycetaceae bacterium]|nr:AAA family ATPase [Planctomycetaceae bacterium]